MHKLVLSESVSKTFEAFKELNYNENDDTVITVMKNKFDISEKNIQKKKVGEKVIDFDTYMKEEFNPFIERIKKYLASEHGLRENEEFDFFLDIQYEAPYYQGDFDKLTPTESQTQSFLCELDDLCELPEPFTNCEKENKLLLELMKKYGYM